MTGLALPTRDFPCKTPAEVRAMLPNASVDVVAFQCRNPVHRAHYELFTRALDAPNVGEGGVVLVHPTCGPTQVRQGREFEPRLDANRFTMPEWYYCILFYFTVPEWFKGERLTSACVRIAPVMNHMAFLEDVCPTQGSIHVMSIMTPYISRS